MGGGRGVAHTTSMDENENLKRHASLEKDFRKIEVREKVMERVYRIQNSSPKKGLKPIKRTILLTSLTVMLVSLTAFAAVELVQIRNATGEIILTTEDVSPDEVADISEIMDTYMDEIQASLAPGEMAAYYVKEDSLKGYDRTSRLRFTFKTTKHASYLDYLAEIERTSAPRLVQPDVLPQGFHYANGEVIPLAPQPLPPGEDDNSEYNQLLERLTARANASTGSSKLFTEQVQWTKADGAKLTFSDGETDISIFSIKGLKASIPQADGAAAQKVQIHGHEAIYIKAGSDEYFTNKLVWVDEGSGIVYTIKDKAGSHLIKDDLIKIAGSMIAGQSF